MGCATVVLRRTESPNYIDLEQRVRADPPLPVVRQIAYVAPKALFGEFDKIAKEALDRIGQPYAVEKTINGHRPTGDNNNARSCSGPNAGRLL
jgi:hypothetical protein